MEEYLEKRTDGETVAVWQILTYGGGYRCGYCMSVCPAGLDLICPYLDNRKEYFEVLSNRFRKEKRTSMFFPGQDQATAVSKKFPNKTVRIA